MSLRIEDYAIIGNTCTVALVGNNGLTRKYPLERHYRDVLCSRVHTPQDDSVVTAAGQQAFAAAAQLASSAAAQLASSAAAQPATSAIAPSR